MLSRPPKLFTKRSLKIQTGNLNFVPKRYPATATEALLKVNGIQFLQNRIQHQLGPGTSWYTGLKDKAGLIRRVTSANGSP